MGSFAVGEVVLVAFPYADFSSVKVRPALVVGLAEFNNIITCQITSKVSTSKKAILLKSTELISGSLKVDSYIRPDKLFTVDKSVIKGRVGSLKVNKIEEVKISLKVIFLIA